MHRLSCHLMLKLLKISNSYVCPPLKAQRSRPQPHPSRPAPSPLNSAQRVPLITHPSWPAAKPPGKTSSTPRAILPRSLLKPTMPRGNLSPLPRALPRRLTLHLTMGSLPIPLDLSPVPLGRLRSLGPDPTYHRRHSLRQMTKVMARPALPPRS